MADIASIFTNNMREADFVARYGGDEFLFIFSNVDQITACKASERIRQAVEGSSFVNGIKITVSGGVLQFRGEAMSDLINAADANLYTAKKKGKNQIACNSFALPIDTVKERQPGHGNLIRT